MLIDCYYAYINPSNPSKPFMTSSIYFEKYFYKRRHPDLCHEVYLVKCRRFFYVTKDKSFVCECYYQQENDRTYSEGINCAMTYYHMCKPPSIIKF